MTYIVIVECLDNGVDGGRGRRDGARSHMQAARGRRGEQVASVVATGEVREDGAEAEGGEEKCCLYAMAAAV